MRLLRGSVLSLVVLVPACNVVVLADDTEGSTSDDGGGMTGGELPTSGADGGEVTGTPPGETGGTPGETGGAPTDGVCDFAGEIQPIFTASCGCHGGGQPAQGLSLAEGSAFAALVGVASEQQPAVMRVEAGAPESSYLVAKLLESPPVGGRMPVGGSLSAAQIELISAWISAGAPEVETFECAGGASSEVGEVEIDAAGPIEVKVGEIVEVDAIVTGPGGEPLPAATVTWTSSLETALYVDGAGALLGVSPGVAELKASSGGVDSAAVMVTVVANVPPAATFTQVLKLTDAKCAVAGCHVDGVEPGDLRFDRDDDRIWEELVEDDAEQVDMRRVRPGAPEDSYLVHKLVMRSPGVGAQMPIGGAPMPASEVQTIVRWILDNAPYN